MPADSYGLTPLSRDIRGKKSRTWCCRTPKFNHQGCCGLPFPAGMKAVSGSLTSKHPGLAGMASLNNKKGRLGGPTIFLKGGTT